MIVEDGDPRERMQALFRAVGPVSGAGIACAALGGACGLLIAAHSLKRVEPTIVMAINWVYDRLENDEFDAEALADEIGLDDRDASLAFAEILCVCISWIAAAGTSREESLMAIPYLLRQFTPS